MDPEILVTELSMDGAVRQFELAVDTLLNACKTEIQGVIADPWTIPDGELYSLLAECQALGSEAFDLATTLKADCSAKQIGARAAAINLCLRWFLARLHLRLSKIAMNFYIPHLDGYEE